MLTSVAPSSDQRDWDVLTAQPAESTLKLDPHTCDPLTASIIDTGDAAYYFELYVNAAPC